MLRILGRSGSINVRKVLWTCEELSLDYTHEPWGEGELSLSSAEFLALNPNARIPVLVDGNFVLHESNAICRYLALRYGNDDLLPSAPEARGVVDQWMDWQATELNEAWRYAFMARVRKSPSHADAVLVERSVSEWNRHMAMLDHALSRIGDYVTPHGFTLADIVLGLTTHRWFMTPMERPRLEAVSDYYERLSDRAGFRLHGRNGVP